MIYRRRKPQQVQRFFRSLRYRLGEFLLRLFVFVLPRIPASIVQGMVFVMSVLSYRLFRKYRKRMEGNIALGLGNSVTAVERESLVRQAWRNFVESAMETIAVLSVTQAQVLSSVTLEGEHHLRAALTKGRGVIALSAHLGSFTMIGPRLAAAGYPFSVVVKPPSDERFARLIDDYRAQVGVHTICAKPRREAVRGILKALRQNHVVLIIADEFKSGDVMVQFFGQRFPAPRGPATIALRTGAVTLPVFAIRQPHGGLTITIGEALKPIEHAEVEESVVATTAMFTATLEQAILRNPEQWNWLGLPRAREPGEPARRRPIKAQRVVRDSVESR